ncbi:50S ribosomal protein L14e [Candidatus Woesearchaeota archaeon]|nr:50S ribosomal protein L14e [Candidatus Woesearchaeota archaeon]
MSIFDTGRLCLKIAGRDAGRRCVVVEKIDSSFVVVDGDVRRRKVNVKHLEPLDTTLEIAEKASSANVKDVFSKHGFAVWQTTSKKPAPRPRHLKKRREATGETKTKE